MRGPFVVWTGNQRSTVALVFPCCSFCSRWLAAVWMPPLCEESRSLLTTADCALLSGASYLIAILINTPALPRAAVALRGFVITFLIAPGDESTWIKYKVCSVMQYTQGGYYELSTYRHEDLDNAGKEIPVIICCLKGGRNYFWLTLFRHPEHTLVTVCLYPAHINVCLFVSSTRRRVSHSSRERFSLSLNDWYSHRAFSHLTPGSKLFFPTGLLPQLH